MTGQMIRRRTLVLVFPVLLALAAACTASTEPAAPPEPPATEPGTTAAPAGASAVAVACTVEVLTPVVSSRIPGSGVDHLTCGSGVALATATPPDGARLVVLRLANGAWTVELDADPNADPAGFLPSDVSRTLYDTWRSRFAPSPTTTRATTDVTSGQGGGGGATGGGGGGGATGGGGDVGGGGGGGVIDGVADPITGCVQNGDVVTCPDIPPVQTTIAPVTTEAPTVTTAPPVTSPPSGGISDYCKANPFDPRCLADPSFPG